MEPLLSISLSRGTDQKEREDFVAYDLSTETERAIEMEEKKR